MSDTPFKTPKAPKRLYSDSEESINSNSDANSESGDSSNGISIVAEYDDLVRSYRHLFKDKVNTETVFMEFVLQTKLMHLEYFAAVDECRRLQSLLDFKTHECSDFENKLSKARQLLDKEKQSTRNMQRERNQLAQQIQQVNELLMKDKGNAGRLSEEMRRKLSFLNNNNSEQDWEPGYNNPQLSAIKEINSTGSILSDFSYSRSEDDLDGSLLQAGKAWKKHRPSNEGVAEPAVKKRRSSGPKVVEIGTTDTVRATTTVTVSKEGPITATSVIESVPKASTGAQSATTNAESYPSSAPPANLVFESWAKGSPRKPPRNINGRQHAFQQKTVVMPETCGLCEKRIGFGRTAIKCKDCKAVCHVECKDNLPTPCIPSVNTPNQKNQLGSIGDYTPITPPMVPAILIHCINEIELRGMSEVGIYRVPGAERDVKNLREKFLKGKGAPCLNQVDIHVLCGTVKDFLRNLHEPLITQELKKVFIAAVENKNRNDAVQALCDAIAKLPQPNRDTLAYLILHLQKVAEAKECKMNTSNLAKVFGPTVVGNTCEDADPNMFLIEIVKHISVMENLLNISSDYWSTFVNVEPVTQPSRLQQTPSTDSLLRSLGPYMTPNRNLNKKRQRFFQSPLH